MNSAIKPGEALATIEELLRKHTQDPDPRATARSFVEDAQQRAANPPLVWDPKARIYRKRMKPTPEDRREPFKEGEEFWGADKL